MALGETPKVGKTYRLPTFDPQVMRSRDVALTVKAESLFVVDDSARFDPVARVWKSALTDTVRAWHVAGAEGAGFNGWVDAQGRVVLATQAAGITLRRMAYELAFENWRIARDAAAAGGGTQRDIMESTAISAGVDLGRGALKRLRVRLLGVQLAGYDLDGGRQTLRGDTLSIERRLVPASYSLTKRPPDFMARFKAELSAEPLLQSTDIAIVKKAI